MQALSVNKALVTLTLLQYIFLKLCFRIMMDIRMGKSGYLDIKILSKGKGLPKRVSKFCLFSSSEFDLTKQFGNENNDVFLLAFP